MFWKVKQEYRSEVFGYALTKIEAMSMGMAQAREGAVSLVVHGMDGKIQTVYSYDDYTWPD
jgi:hypothetical protein